MIYEWSLDTEMITGTCLGFQLMQDKGEKGSQGGHRGVYR